MDLGWPTLNEQARAQARRYLAELEADRGSVTLAWLKERLEAASRALAGHELFALAEAEAFDRVLLAARDGAVVEVSFLDAFPDGRRPGIRMHDFAFVELAPKAAAEVLQAISAAALEEAEYEEYDQRLELPFHYRSEEALRAVVETLVRAAPRAQTQLIAEAGSERFFVAVMRGRQSIERLVPTPSTGEVVHRDKLLELVRASAHELLPVPLTAADFKAAGVERVARALFYPEDMLRQIQLEASRLDWSLSRLMHESWAVLLPEVRAATSREDLQRFGPPPSQLSSLHRRKRLYFSVPMLAELEEAADRLGVPESWLVQMAWIAARPVLAQRRPGA